MLRRSHIAMAIQNPLCRSKCRKPTFPKAMQTRLSFVKRFKGLNTIHHEGSGPRQQGGIPSSVGAATLEERLGVLVSQLDDSVPYLWEGLDRNSSLDRSFMRARKRELERIQAIHRDGCDSIASLQSRMTCLVDITKAEAWTHPFYCWPPHP